MTTMFITTRDITSSECHWIKETIEKGTVVYRFSGATYGCIGPGGVAITFDEGGANPFFELPGNSLKELPIR